MKEIESKIESKIKIKEILEEKDINSITVTIINRMRFTYLFKDILQYLLKCVCLRGRRALKRTKSLRKHFYFNKAQDRL